MCYIVGQSIATGFLWLQALGWTKSRSHVLLVGSLVHILDDANKLAGSPVPYTKFHNAAVSSAVMQSLQVEWMAWQHVKRGLVQYGLLEPMPQSLCQLPFLMTPECKKVIMQGEAMLMQNHEVQNSLDRAMMLMQQGAVRIHPNYGIPTIPCKSQYHAKHSQLAHCGSASPLRLC
jgi:hypothetical protein